MIPFSPPRIDDKIINAVVEAIQSGWITTGPRTRLFEQRLTEFCGSKATLCVNSSTAGMELALRWFGIQQGDEVILPAYTYCATANVIMHCGATPVFVDSGKDFCIDPEKIREAVTNKTKAIMPVDFGGMPCDYDRIYQIINEPGIKELFLPLNGNQKKLGRIMVLSDAAHSLGAEYKGKRVGSLGDISVVSFHAVKNLTTGEGGCICLYLPEPFDNALIYRSLCLKSLHGQTKDALEKTQPGAWKYDVVEAGYKFNMTDILAAMGLVELSRYKEDTLRKRRHIFEKYSEALSRYDWAELPESETEEKLSSFHLFPLRIKGITEKMRDDIISGISRREVAVNVHFIPVPMLSFYRNLGFKISEYPVSRDNYRREISLPIFYDLSDKDIDIVLGAVIHSVREVLDKVRKTPGRRKKRQEETQRI